MINENKAYLGDSVYAKSDGYHIILTTENGIPGDPSNEIFLNPIVISNLLEYQEWLEQQLKVEGK